MAASVGAVSINWLQAVIDVPAERFELAAEFWTTITNSSRGEIDSSHDEYLHLVPPSGHMHLELQRTDANTAGAHMDLLVDDIDAVVEQACALGATLVTQSTHAVLQTPGGVPFCVVAHNGESERAPVIDSALPHAVDQICLDVPAEHFETDIAFWSQLTGWSVNPPRSPEFRSFDQPAHLPLRILIQRLGDDDTGGPRSHLDISCGDHVAQLTERHEAAGATATEHFKRWTLLADPVDMPYCLTARPPSVGSS